MELPSEPRLPKFGKHTQQETSGLRNTNLVIMDKNRTHTISRGNKALMLSNSVVRVCPWLACLYDPGCTDANSVLEIASRN